MKNQVREKSNKSENQKKRTAAQLLHSLTSVRASTAEQINQEREKITKHQRKENGRGRNSKEERKREEE